MKKALLYALTTAAIIVVTGWLLSLAFSGRWGAAASDAVLTSAIVAGVVQIAAFGATRLLAPKNIIAAWGAGSLVRLLTLGVYGLLVVKTFGLSPAPALLSMAVFFFLLTLVEPLFLRR